MTCLQRRWCRFRRAVAGAALLAALGGCGADSSDRPAAPVGRASPSQSQQSIGAFTRAYADLRHGSFRILADCNAPAQAAWFRTLDAAGSETPVQPAITARHSRDETGAHALEATFASVGDRLVFDGSRADPQSWTPDWTPYHLLLMSVRGPRDGVTFELILESRGHRSARRTLFARPGWNLYRLDLLDFAEDVDLADVATLSWRIMNAATPVQLVIDDLILADNTRMLLGRGASPGAGASEGDLYAYLRGRRLVVGAAGRFELVFRDGLIRRWSVLGGASAAVTVGLGPWPIPLDAEWRTRADAPLGIDDGAVFSAWGPTVDAGQSVQEASPTRVVVRGQWRFMPLPGDDRGAVRERRPGHEWLYVVYPDGRVYVRVGSHAAGESWPSSHVGWGVVLDGRSGVRCVLPEIGFGESRRIPFVLALTPGATSLLWTPSDPAIAAGSRQFGSVDGLRLASIFGDRVATSDVSTAHLLRFWPPAALDLGTAEAVSGDYQQPARLTVEVGALRCDASGDGDADGFNESEGLYELVAEGERLRFQLDPGSWLRGQPRMRIANSRGRAADATIDDQPAAGLHWGRDGQGNLLVTLPNVFDRPIVAEFTLRRL